MRRLHTALLAITILTSAACHGDLFDVSGNGKYSYDIQTPRNYGNSGTRKWAVLVLLHGAGGLTTNPIATYSSYADSFPFILVTPHTTTEWEADRLSNVLNEVEDKYRVDEHRIYVTGFSMGAHGAFTWMAAEPSRIAAAVAIAGGTSAGDACKSKAVPVWLIHNRNDPVVPTSESERTFNELSLCSAEVRLTVNEDPPYLGTHDAWSAAYTNPAVYSWLLTHTK
jgi:predicted peptidase